MLNLDLCICVHFFNSRIDILNQSTMDERALNVHIQRVRARVNRARSINVQNDIPPCSSRREISWTVLTPQQCGALRARPHPAPPCLLYLWFLMTKCIETIGCTLPSIRWHSEGSLFSSGPQDFRRLTKQLLLALDWLAAMLFRPTGKSLCESAGLNEVARSLPSVHLLTY